MPHATTLDSFLSENHAHIADRAIAALKRFALPTDDEKLAELKRRAEANARRHDGWSESDTEENLSKYHRLLFVHALSMRDETEIEVVFSPKTQRVRTRATDGQVAEPSVETPVVGAPQSAFEPVPAEKGALGRFTDALFGMFRPKVTRVSVNRSSVDS